MTQAEHTLSVLLVNDQPEEIKLLATSLRGFFAGCRVEAAYTSDQALQFAREKQWHLFLIDEQLEPRSGIDLVASLKRNHPHAAIILQTNRSDAATAVTALRQGADFLLFKSSPGFLTELLFYAKEAMEKRDLKVTLEHTYQRYLRLVESIDDIVYELDHAGRFVYVNPLATSRLGYTLGDLAGQHFSILLPPTQEYLARYRMNERRTGARAVARQELLVLGKPSLGGHAPEVPMRLTAKGLYDEHRRYFGTVGILQNVSREREQIRKMQNLEDRLQEADRQLAASQRALLSSQRLQEALSALRWSSQDLLTALQSIHLKHNVTQLAAHAAETCDIGRAVSRSHLDTSHSLRFVVVGSELERAIASLRQERTLDLRVIVQRFGHGIPAIAGDAQAVYRLFHSLLEYATQSCADTPAHGGLLIETYVQQYSDTISDVATQQPRSCIPYVVIVVHQSTEAMPVPKEAFPQPMSGSDFLKAHDLVGQYGGSIEIRPAGPAPLQLILRLPAADSPQFSMIAGKAIQARRTHAAPASTMPARTSTRSPVRFRRHGRTMLQVPVELTIGSTAWQTTAMDIGVGGMRLAVGEQFPPMDNQPVSLIIRTPVSFLELPGIGRHRVTTTIAHISRHVFIEFASLLHTEAAVLKSLIESLQEQSIMMKLEIAIHGTPDRPS